MIEKIDDLTDEIKGYVVTGVTYEDDLILVLDLLNPETKELFQLQIKPVGRHCDDLWLAHSIEKVD